MTTNIDFPALLQTLGRQDQQFREQHGILFAPNGERDYFNIWEAPQLSPLQYVRLAQEQIIRDRGPEWSELLDQRLAEERERLYATLAKYASGRSYDWDGLRRRLESRGIPDTQVLTTMPLVLFDHLMSGPRRGVRNVSMMATMPLVEPTRLVMSGTSAGIYPVREPYIKKVPMNNEPRDRGYDQDTSTMASAEDESSLEREDDGDSGDIPGTEDPITIKLSQNKKVWDYLNGFQFQGDHNIENERQDTFELEVTEADHDNFVTGILDEIGLDAFAYGIMPSLL